jgi:hypothetical protein
LLSDSKGEVRRAITLELRLELKGDVNEHAVLMALNELLGMVTGLKVEDVKRRG